MNVAIKVGHEARVVVTTDNGLNINGELAHRLLEGVVGFVFTKVDGTERMAYGTLKPELIPDKEISDLLKIKTLVCMMFAASDKFMHDESYNAIRAIYDKWVSASLNKKEDTKAVSKVVVYWDLEASAFRSFKPETLVAVF